MRSMRTGGRLEALSFLLRRGEFLHPSDLIQQLGDEDLRRDTGPSLFVVGQNANKTASRYETF